MTRGDQMTRGVTITRKHFTSIPKSSREQKYQGTSPRWEF